MQFIKSFSRITREDYDTVGYLAADLALVLENNFRIPLTFVISNTAYNAFLEKNGLKNKLMQLYRDANTDEKLITAYEEVKKLFISGEVSKDFEEEIFESYHSLGGSLSSINADSIIQQTPNPKVMLVKSPGYIMEDDDLSGIFLNVQGEEKLIKAIKLCWASLFSPESVGYRISHSIKFPETCGIIVQQFLTKGRNAIAKVNNKTIDVEAYLGITDSHNELAKDKFVVDREYLHIIESKVKFQQYRIAVEDSRLVRIPLKQEGSEQKLNDKEVMEASRTAKRITHYLGKNAVVRMTILDDKFLVKLVYRKTSPEPIEYEEISKAEEKIVEDVKEEIREFEEQPEGEVSEIEITVQEEEPEEVSEDETLEDTEYASFDYPQETTPVREEKKIIPEVEIYEEEYSDKEEVFKPAVEVYEENEIIKEEKLDEEYVEEPKVEIYEEDFIMSMPEEKELKKIEPKNISKEEHLEEKPTKIPIKESSAMKELRFDASSIIIKIYKELVDAVSDKCDELYGTLPASFAEGIKDLSGRFRVSEQDLMEVKRLRDDFINNNKALTSSELKFVLDTANETLSILAPR